MATNLTAQLKSLKMIYWAMAISQLFFGVAVYVITTIGFLGSPDYDMAIVMQKVALIFVPATMAMGYFVFKYMLSKLDPRMPLEEKIKKYFSMVLVRAALFEAAFFYCGVAALISNVQLFLWIAPVVFFVFLLMRPTPESMTNDMQLSPADSRKLTES